MTTMTRYIYIFILSFLSLSMVAEAQEQKGYRGRAEQFFRSGEYMRAAEIYTRLVDVKKPRVHDLERLGEAYLYISDYVTAENWLSRAYRTEGHSQATVLHYAEALKQNGRYAEAKQVLEGYVSRYGDSEEVSLQIAGCDSAVLWLAHPTSHRIHNLEAVNTDLSEFGFFPTSNGGIYAAEPKVHSNNLKSQMTGRGFLKVFSVESVEDDYVNPVVMDGAYNDAKYHVGPIIADAAQRTLYVTRTHPEKENTERYKDANQRFRRHNLELVIYSLNDNGEWSEEEFAYNNVKEFSLGHAALSKDEQRLYYASDMPGGYGGVDIWYSERESDGTWGAPVNAGAKINTAGDEMFPSVYEDRLFFSSNGHVGMGGLDIFESEISVDTFAKPINLQYPVNSASDDFSFVMLQDNFESIEGFLSSNRVGGVGGDDIYRFSYVKPKIIITLEGITLNKKTGERLPASTVSLFAPTGQLIARKSADAQGDFAFSLDRGTPYIVRAEHEGFHSDSTYIAAIFAKKDTIVKAILELEPIFVVGEKFVLENIYYDFDKHNIRKDAAKVLDELVITMRDNPSLKIELSSHTDSRGSDSYNMKLSQRRAQAAVDYLVSRGIARDRMVAKGYGESRLVNHCKNGVPCSIAEHQANRRTEVEVLEY